jgi:hypothetical protein
MISDGRELAAFERQKVWHQLFTENFAYGFLVLLEWVDALGVNDIVAVFGQTPRGLGRAAICD